MGYNEFKDEIKQIDDTIKDLKNQIPEKGVRDKCGLDFVGSQEYNLPKISSNHSQTIASIDFHASHGSYGSSSCYSDMSPSLAKAVLFALRELEPSIILKAIKILEEQKRVRANKMRIEAEDILEAANQIGATTKKENG